MTSVDFITFCCPKDIVRLSYPNELLHWDNELTHRIESHQYDFAHVYLIRQRCRGLFDHISFDDAIEIESEDHPNIFQEFGIADNPYLDDLTHGPDAAHYWRWHVMNHLIGLKLSTADYIVFSDCDCRMISKGLGSWISQGIDLLEKYNEILIVSPSDGGDMAEKRIGNVHLTYGVSQQVVTVSIRLTQNVSQQVFMANRERFKNMNFDIPWNPGDFSAPGGPMQEYYGMLEGRIWRMLRAHGLYRAILPDYWRYWHDQW